MKVLRKDNVYEAFTERIAYVCSKFDQIIISFSGGKDSGVMLELVHQYFMRFPEKTKGIRVSVFYLDYEGNYEKTKEYVERCMGKYNDFEYYHICLPVSASCGISMYCSTWLPWDPEHQELWVSKIPQNAISLENHDFDFFEVGMNDYVFQKKFCKWLHNENKAKRTAILVGIRAQESVQRYNAVTRDDTFSMFGTISYSHRISYNVFDFYPLYDWKVEDIWLANAKFAWDYNKLYDLFFQAGVSLKNMRVANPFHKCGVSSLRLYKAIEPDTWGTLVGRVTGANFASIYGNTRAMGYKNITLPKGHNWKSYLTLLLQTCPKETREIYKKKFQTSIKYWVVQGGALPNEVVRELEKISIKYENLGKPKNNRKYKKEYSVIRFEEYPDDVPIKSFKLVPSYKRMCITLLKNDTSCYYMGFSQTKDELSKKEKAISIWKNLL